MFIAIGHIDNHGNVPRAAEYRAWNADSVSLPPRTALTDLSDCRWLNVRSVNGKREFHWNSDHTVQHWAADTQFDGRTVANLSRTQWVTVTYSSFEGCR